MQIAFLSEANVFESGPFGMRAAYDPLNGWSLTSQAGEHLCYLKLDAIRDLVFDPDNAFQDPANEQIPWT